MEIFTDLVNVAAQNNLDIQIPYAKLMYEFNLRLHQVFSKGFVGVEPLGTVRIDK
jgi:hypothetical protein